MSLIASQYLKDFFDKIDPEAGFLVQGFSAVTVTGLCVELGHQHLYPNGSQLPGKNQGLGKGSHVY